MRRPRFRLTTLCATSAAALTAIAMGGAGVAAATPATSMAVIPGSYLPADAPVTGQLSSPSMSIEVVLQPGNVAGLNALLAGQYTQGSAQYGKWLAQGQFQSEFAPAASTVAAVSAYLEGKGLTVQSSSSVFLLSATGSSQAVESAFATPIDTYKTSNGTSFFSNAKAASVPTSVAGEVLGVVGLSNTVRAHSSFQIAEHRHPVTTPSCETPYPTVAQLDSGVQFAYGYGGGPDCSGLTPSQTNSIYNAPQAGSSAQGAGATLAVFELSGYTESDITTWAQQFYGRYYHPRLVNINVDGGPLTSSCPKGDECLPGYAGDVEVDADLEQELSISPDINQILVYNAPNDYTGQTELDEYNAIAKDDTADSISSSWGECEIDAGSAYVQAENLIFEQMAAQGQSMFSSAGDTGAYDCIRDGSGSLDEYGLQVDDPATQPWVTSVGGTSLETDNPGANPTPQYPQGIESVWNVDDLCSGSSAGLAACDSSGAGGGGSSMFWGRPAYQRGPGVNNKETKVGPSKCSLAAAGQACREVPDVSANADEYTPYTEYCTGTAASSACAFYDQYFGSDWFGIGGTSLSSPLWAATLADRDAYQGYRSGNANYLLYGLFNQNYQNYSRNDGDFHDITGAGQTTNQNGYYYVTPGYDEATGIGTPNLSNLITDYRGYY
ncbi:MAG: S53 family peptidase [Candidatus Dormiibacterota bacterium]